MVAIKIDRGEGALKVFLAGTSFHHSYGGPAFSVSRLSSALAGAGINIGVWAPDGSAVTTRLIAEGLPMLRRFGGSLEIALENFGRPDILHDNGIWLPSNHRAAVLADTAEIPRIVSLRGMLEPWALRHKRIKKAIAWSLYQRRDLKSAALLHATADSECNHIGALNLRRPIAVIPNGTDLPDEQELRRQNHDRAPRTALFLSRIHPKKGLPMLVDAWARLRPSDWMLRIAGPDEGGHRAEVEALVTSAGIADVVQFSGELSGREKTAAYASADLFILPTHSENFGMVVAEALAHEVPVVTTSGAPWQTLVDHACGWWVPPTAEGIAEGLHQALSCPPDTLRDMGRRGRILVAAQYGWDGIALRFLATYEAVMASRRS
ncbi:glycosyltransferase [Rhodomicrobium sp. Az07]|uniref:glycosyltransferase n=1 Tax=Rhodomicrobium sp. Az07 TaxID=2839034 RepID=UPI001BE66405|nr:glycosyltransferase [Rhodomicrobium sp. Az07]MBT3070836.1 glycosyltransferase [Rhodomicrobium sp. Az07]